MTGRSVTLPDGSIGVVVRVRVIRGVQCAEVVVGAQRRLEVPTADLRPLASSALIVRVAP